MKTITFKSISKSFFTLLFLAFISVSANINAATYYVRHIQQLQQHGLVLPDPQPFLHVHLEMLSRH